MDSNEKKIRENLSKLGLLNSDGKLLKKIIIQSEELLIDGIHGTSTCFNDHRKANRWVKSFALHSSDGIYYKVSGQRVQKMKAISN
tara:strand:+ start:7011 stop:7268 length:258 start_codon:yes stop_codon:yes gene_type:complete